MKHIANEYGSPCNLLELTSDELKALEPFLLALGVRCRTTMAYGDKKQIQAENVYRTWIGQTEREQAKQELTDEQIKIYKR